jgi:hypothetical protein
LSVDRCGDDHLSLLYVLANSLMDSVSHRVKLEALDTLISLFLVLARISHQAA